MKLYLLVLFTFTSATPNCDLLGVALYEDLACTPNTLNNSCPSSFLCNLHNPTKCVVQGKTYSSGEAIEKNHAFSCRFGCFCTTQNNQPAISCAQGSCAEWSGLPPSPNCYRRYNLEQCCSSGEICPPFDGLAKCVVDGVEYKEGEWFAPKDSCDVCLCQKGFTGDVRSPFCKRQGCDAQVRNQKEIQKSCAPLYIKRDGDGEKICCPSTWICPDGSEIIEKVNSESKELCKFGEKSLGVGDWFRRSFIYNFRSITVKCECKIPPLLTCRQE